MIDIRKQLQDSRAAQVQADRELRHTAAQIKQFEQSLVQLKRAGRTPDNDDQAAELLAQMRHLQTRKEQLRARYSEGVEAVAAATELYAHLLLEDRDELQDMDADCPFLLLPLRLETRFVTTLHGTSQLWVRVYPDDLAIETHEPPLTSEEHTAGEAYWRSMWRAADDVAAQKEAWAALVQSTGTSRAAWIARALTPTNSPPADPVFPPLELRSASWSQPARVRVMPDRLVVMTYAGGQRIHMQAGGVIPDPLIVGPDPSKKSFVPQDGKLEFSDEMAWLVDFEAAVKIGMGVKIDLTPEQAKTGFDRVVVLGVRRTRDRLEGVGRLQALFDSHHYTDGLSLIPQGTPTNNTPSAPAGPAALDVDTIESWHVERGEPLFSETTANRSTRPDLGVQKDGQRLAEALGLPYETFQHIRNADNTDALEARAMNNALYPGTLGYYGQELLMPPLKDRKWIFHLRQFMVDYVSGRGPLPALRIGDQPYGVLPTTAISRINWFQHGDFVDVPPVQRLLPELLKWLNILRRTWTELSQRVARVGLGDDPDQTMLDILALHPVPAEFYTRNAATANFSRNYLVFNALDDVAIPVEEERIARARDILDELGLPELLPAKIMSLLWFRFARLLDGPVVEEGVPSETKRLSQITPQGNYIDWIAQSDIATLRDENLGLDEQGQRIPSPRALLYLLLNYAMQRALIDAGNNVRESEGLSAHLQEPAFINVSAPREKTVWHQFSEPVRMSQGLPLGLFLQTEAALRLPNLADLRDTRKSLSLLSALSTARLERLVAEHLALCSYRLDAWYTGLVYWQLTNRIIPGRAVEDRQDFVRGTSRGRGVYLGAYGYVEDLRPTRRARVTVERPPDDYDDPIPLHKAPPDNAGFIHAASIRQATAAAVLRTGHLTHAAAPNSATMAVNLSSARVRRAEWYLEGMRMGQKVGALLGYQFERGLHDNQLNLYVQAFRQRFPFELDPGKPLPPGVPMEALAARNVVDGQKLVQVHQTSGFPYGIAELNAAPALHQTIIRQLVQQTAESLDAVADLALAEGVFQASIGNHERAAAMLDAVSRGGIPPEAEFVRTPRSGTSLAHAVGAVFPAAVPANLNWIGTTPRAEAEPRLNAWIDRLLGNPADIRGQAQIAGQAGPATFSAAELNLSALDFVMIVGEDLVPGSELERRIVFALRRREGLDDVTEITLNLIEPDALWTPAVKTFFQILPLARALRRIVSECRPLNANDLIVPYSPVSDEQDRRRNDVAELQTRADAAQQRLQTAHDELVTAQNDVLLNGQPADIERLRLALIDAAAFGLPDFPANSSADDAKAAQTLRDQADSALKTLGARLEAAQQAATAAGAIAAANNDERATAVRGIIAEVFGGGLNILPLFTPHNAPELTQSFAAQNDLLKGAPPLATDSWLHSLTRVRQRIASVEELRMFASMFSTADDSLSLSILQMPHTPGSRWLALPLEKTPLERGSVRALALMLPQVYQPADAQCGLLFDDWTEVIPGTHETTGIAVHFDQPNAEAPQALLLALAPHLEREWRWDDLVATVLETFELAKERAVDTDQIDTTRWAQMLPALVTAVTPKNTTASLHLLKNAKSLAHLAANP